MTTIPIYKRRLEHREATSFLSITGSRLRAALFDFKKSDQDIEGSKMVEE